MYYTAIAIKTVWYNRRTDTSMNGTGQRSDADSHEHVHLFIIAKKKYTHDIRFVILTIPSVQFSGIDYAHHAMQPSPLHSSNPCTTPKRNSVRITQGSPAPRQQPLVIASLLFVSTTFSVLGSSCTWNHKIFILLRLVYFTQHNCFQGSSILEHASKFRFIVEYYSIVWIYYSLFINSPGVGHLEATWVAYRFWLPLVILQ